LEDIYKSEVPIAMFTGKNDILATVYDARETRDAINNN